MSKIWVGKWYLLLPPPSGPFFNFLPTSTNHLSDSEAAKLGKNKIRVVAT